MIHTIEVSAGEIIDRITILDIKVNKIKESTAAHDNVLKQRVGLNQHIKELFIMMPDIPSCLKLSSLFGELSRVNTLLWQIEDQLRKKENDGLFDDDFIQLARSVYILNDQRGKLKKDIDILSGSYISEEKLYSSYDTVHDRPVPLYDQNTALTNLL